MTQGKGVIARLHNGAVICMLERLALMLLRAILRLQFLEATRTYVPWLLNRLCVAREKYVVWPQVAELVKVRFMR